MFNKPSAENFTHSATSYKVTFLILFNKLKYTWISMHVIIWRFYFLETVFITHSKIITIREVTVAYF